MNSRNLATAWIQDFDQAIVVGFSTTGGRRWKNVVPETTPCTGGPPLFHATEFAERDPSLSFGPSLGPTAPNGIAYLSSNTSYFVNTAEVGTAVLVNRSLDGGKTWPFPPVVVDEAPKPLLIDGDSVIADPDPARTGYAYDSEMKGAQPGERNQYVSHTTDGGASWTKPVALPPGTGPLKLWGQLLALPDGTAHGTLVDVITEIRSISEGPTTLIARRSTDRGETWPESTTIAEADKNLVVTSSAALAPDRRTIYVSWWEGTSAPSTFSLKYSKSTDLGVTWSKPPKAIGEPVDRPLMVAGLFGLGKKPAFPGLAVAPNGTVGVTFYTQHKEPSQATDYWLRFSPDEGRTWEDEKLAGPFDLSTTPEVGVRIGDYQGIAPIAGGFANTFALAQPLELEGKPANFKLGSKPTDIFFDKVRTHRRHKR